MEENKTVDPNDVDDRIVTMGGGGGAKQENDKDINTDLINN